MEHEMSWAEFLHMGGYAFYVWTSFGLALIVLSGNVLYAVKRKKKVIQQLKRRAMVQNPR
jgi:heme exporter protein D